jgi:hypothetical protein
MTVKVSHPSYVMSGIIAYRPGTEWNCAMQERSRTSLSNLEAAIQDTLATIVEIDRWYDLELGELDFYPEAIRGEVAAKIEQRRRLNRQPYVLHLAHLHQMIVSARIFGDPAVSLRPRRTGSSPFPTASHSELQDGSARLGEVQSNPGSSGSATLAKRSGVPLASEGLGLGGADQQ